MTNPRRAFPAPFAVLVTDELGNPLPVGTEVIFVTDAADCLPNIIVPVDSNGFAAVECIARELPLGISPFLQSSMNASLVNDPALGSAKFDFTVSISASSLELEIVSGNMQTGRTNEPLDAPLVVRLVAPFGGIGQSLIGVQMEQTMGAGAIITPSFLALRDGVATPVEVILGPAAGPVGISARALSPESPSADFMIEAVGGIPTSFEKEGDQQSGRIGRTLDSALRMRVRNELGEVIPFPMVDWTVTSGDASLLTRQRPGWSDSGGQPRQYAGPDRDPRYDRFTDCHVQCDGNSAAGGGDHAGRGSRADPPSGYDLRAPDRRGA